MLNPVSNFGKNQIGFGAVYYAEMPRPFAGASQEEICILRARDTGFKNKHNRLTELFNKKLGSEPSSDDVQCAIKDLSCRTNHISYMTRFTNEDAEEMHASSASDTDSTGLRLIREKGQLIDLNA